MSCLKGTGPPSGPQSPPGSPRTASDAPRENFAEKHPFHLFRPKTKVKTAGNKHEAIWINRPFYGIVYRSLRQRARVFWLEVFVAQIVIVLVGWLLFALVATQQRGLALDLSLQSVGLSIQERQCGANADWCRYVAAVLSFGQRVFEWVVSAVVIVRVFRGVAKGRWKFDRHAVIHDGELRIRVASLKPGTVLALEVTVEVIVESCVEINQ